MPILALFLLAAWAWAQPVRVVAASDLRYALPEILALLQAERPGLRVEVVYSSSGRLYQQIQQGLPADLFLSADETYPQKLFAEGLTQGPPAFYARGQLALWLHRRLGLKPLGPEALKDPKVEALALANPIHAPYGRAAVAFLEYHGLIRRQRPLPPWEEMRGGLEAYFDLDPLRQGKGRFTLVYGENATQAAQLALTAGAGLIPLSLALSPEVKALGGYWVVPQGHHPPLRQALVVLKGLDRPEVLFLKDFLLGPKAQAILRRWGFLPP